VYCDSLILIGFRTNGRRVDVVQHWKSRPSWIILPLRHPFKTSAKKKPRAVETASGLRVVDKLSVFCQYLNLRHTAAF
jgi:hypothetical protein